MVNLMGQLLPTFCGKDCGGNACPLLALVENGRVMRVQNNPAGGRHILACARGFDLPAETYSPDRILTPLVRSGPRGSGQFRQASWKEALQITADRLGEIRAKHGPQAVLSRGSAGTIGALHATYAVLGRFLNGFGGCTYLTQGYSFGAGSTILPYLLGEDTGRSGFDAATMQYSEMIVLWGANVLETRHGAEVPQRLLEAARRGGQIVSIEPRRSYTAEQTGAWWLPCRPGMDTALMLAVLYVLLSENLADRAFIAAHSSGFEQLEQYVLGLDGGTPRSPAWAQDICGTPADEIVRFARAYAAARPALLFPGYSIQRVQAGETPYRLTIVLQIATGNFGAKGGSSGSSNNLLPGPRLGSLPGLPCPPQPNLPAARWPDAVLEGRAGGYPSDIHAIYNLGSNSLVQGADIHKNIAAFNKLDFAVSHDLFMTPTARYCDVIFPSSSPLEKEDVCGPWAGNYLLYKSAVLSPRGQARSDYDALCELADLLGFGAAYSEGKSASDWVAEFIAQSEVPDPVEFRRSGVYLAPDQERVGLADFRADPLAHPLKTPSGRVEIASPRYQAETGLPAFPTWQQPASDACYPLSLITPKTRFYTHSQSNFGDRGERPAHALTIHPLDAAARGIVEGAQVRILNAQGEGRVPAHLSPEIMPGVVSLPEGIWARIDAEGIDQAGSANMFTSTQGTHHRNVIMHGVGVEVLALLP